MNSFWRIFSLELTGFVRSKMLLLLLGATVAWVLSLPHLVQGDGTAEGLRELSIRYSLGGVLALLVVTLLASATGSLARERTAKRLQLTLVRPVHYTLVVLAKGLAHLAVGAGVLAVALGVQLLLLDDLGRPCCYVLKPVLPSPREEAREMYAAFMVDPDTPVEAKKARKSTVLRLLETKALDHYQTIPTNSVTAWNFPRPSGASDGLWAVRLRFTNQFDTRDDIRGVFTLGASKGIVSNITQAVLKIPLTVGRDGEAFDGPMTLSFANHGRNPLMLRPRKDLDLLLPADAFGWNLLRAYVTMVSVLALVIAFGMFLSASLGRPVALFVAIVTLIVSEMSPSVVEQYPDELETKALDRVGLVLARAAAEVTRPVSALNPLEKLALDECIEPQTVRRAVLLNVFLLPIFLALLSGFILPRKPE